MNQKQAPPPVLPLAPSTADTQPLTSVSPPPSPRPAPELLEGQGAVPQTDIWAIGVTTFIM